MQSYTEVSLNGTGSHQEATEPHSCCGAVAEPTEQEFNNALAEATQELQVASSLRRPCQRDMDVFDGPPPNGLHPCL